MAAIDTRSHAPLVLSLALLAVGAVGLLTSMGDQVDRTGVRVAALGVAIVLFAVVHRLDRVHPGVRTFMWVGVFYATVQLVIRSVS